MARTFSSINPKTLRPLKTYERISPGEVDRILSELELGFRKWRSTHLSERLDLLRRIGKSLLEQKEDLARIATQEMGKPISQSLAEVEKSARVCDYYAEKASEFLKPEIIEGAGEIHYQPTGCLLAIMPWNFPYWQVFRVLAPNLAAGNVIALKHASNVPGCGMAIEKLVKEQTDICVLRNLLVESSEVEKIIADSRVNAVTLTGSTAAGRKVAEAAGRHLKKSVLELGGSDAYLILEDAPIEQTAKVCAESRLINTGQSCIAAKRFIVPSSIYKNFQESFAEQLFKKKLGDPELPETELGPLAKKELADQLEEQLSQSEKLGAKIIRSAHGKREGAFFPPCIVIGAKKGMKVYDEETFGPLAALIEARNESEAVELANNTSFGLGAAVFSQDIERARRIAIDKLQAGACFVNDFVKSDPRLPFGGIKESGYGRELGLIGIREFLNIKTVVSKTF